LDSNMAVVLNVIACKLGSKADRNAIPTANHTFFWVKESSKDVILNILMSAMASGI